MFRRLLRDRFELLANEFLPKFDTSISHTFGLELSHSMHLQLDGGLIPLQLTATCVNTIVADPPPPPPPTINKFQRS